MAAGLSNIPKFLLLPGELMLLILSFLDIDQVLALRQTCIKMAQFTQERSLWLSLLHQQQENLPHPSYLKSYLNPLSEVTPPSVILPPSAIESEVTSAYRIARSWTRPRIHPPHRLRPRSTESLLGLEVFLDRWLLSVYSEGLVSLWDIVPRGSTSTIPNSEEHSEAPAILCASLDLGSTKWVSFTSALDPSRECIVLAVTQITLPPTTRLYRVNLKHSDPTCSSDNFELLYTIPSPMPQVARTIEPASRLVVLSGTNTVEIVHWPSDYGEGAIKTLMSISMQRDDLEEVWNGIIGIRIMGPYIVIFKSRSIEFYLLAPDGVHIPLLPLQNPVPPGPSPPGFPNMTHRFQSITFRYISPSDYVTLPESATQEDIEVLQFNFFGYDTIQGVFHYNVCVRSTPPSLNVECIGAYALASNIDMRSIFLHGSSLPPNNSPGPSALPTPTPTLASTSWLAAHAGIFGQASDHTRTSPSSRGFVSAMALGPQGKRGVWVERKRGSTLREILVWSKKPRDAEDVRMHAHVVYEIGSYDLREDIIHCAIAEVSGRIILGNRAGDILILSSDF